MGTSMRRINGDNYARFVYQKNLDNGGIYILTTSPTNVFSDSKTARNNSVSVENSSAMLIIKQNYTVAVVGKSMVSGEIAVQIRCGNKYGWVYIGKVEATGSSSGTSFKWKAGPYIAMGITENHLKDYNGVWYDPAKMYESLNATGSTINKKATVKINDSAVAAAEDTTEAKDEATASSISSSNDNANSGEINVTYEYAVKVSPYTYIYNMADYTKNNSYENYAKSNTIQKGIDYSKLRFVFGIPYQYLPTTDCRVGNNYSTSLEQTGYEFAEKIVSRMPLLYITPGNTSFMGGTTENYRTALLGSLGDRAPGAASAEDALTETSLETMLGEYNGKLYTIMPAYTEYFKYVNPYVELVQSS